ncbi:hypothetical protein B0H67DRAFT_103593 [Lasiosphaeris hirsuta]|uniref:Uncharacterized protein n=1 Tax=Lasiosphaeris hirsuta TaxID=260670 RepID=A0AA40AYL8_9PEZI|nr:hypothetical protein B0H67DRAFT_103593 [Lasiosphaeris hirsuta]
MSAALAALKKVQTALRSARSSSDKREASALSCSDKMKASARPSSGKTKASGSSSSDETKASVSSGSNETKKSVTAPHGWSEPAPLGRSAKTGGCRLPQLDLIASAWEARRGSEQHEIDAPTSEKLTADLARPFGQSTGRGLSLTRFRTYGAYNTVSMRQRDVWPPWMGPGHTATLRTLYEIGHVITHADPICEHLRWADEYHFLVPNMANFSLDQRFSEEEARRIATFSLPITTLDSQITPLLPERVFMNKRLQCALFHMVDCMCLDSTPFGALKCCPRCYADYSVNIAPDAAPGRPDGRLLVFTTWKCLGSGTERSHYWLSHLTSANSERHYALGHAHWSYEPGPSHPLKHEINVTEIQRFIASARSSPRESPLEYSYTAVAGPGFVRCHN